MGLMDGKRGLVVGIANERSIAHGIARAAADGGAALALTYQDERLATCSPTCLSNPHQK